MFAWSYNATLAEGRNVTDGRMIVRRIWGRTFPLGNHFSFLFSACYSLRIAHKLVSFSLLVFSSHLQSPQWILLSLPSFSLISFWVPFSTVWFMISTFHLCMSDHCSMFLKTNDKVLNREYVNHCFVTHVWLEKSLSKLNNRSLLSLSIRYVIDFLFDTFLTDYETLWLLFIHFWFVWLFEPLRCLIPTI